MKNNNEKLENKVMSEIRSGCVKLKSKYVFLAEKLGLGSTIILTVLLAVLFFSLAFFYVKSSGNLFYLGFGRSGLAAFLETFPYWLVIGLVVCLFIAGYVLEKSNWSYKIPFKYVALFLVMIVLFSTVVITFLGIPNYIDSRVYNHPMREVFRPFMGIGDKPHHNGVEGKVYEIIDSYLIIETPRGLEKINLTDCFNCNDNFVKDQFVIAIGQRIEGDFMVRKIKVLDKNNFPPLIKREIDSKFLIPRMNSNSFPPPHLLNFDDKTNNCLDSCFEKEIYPKKCFQECVLKKTW
jgi:hypothetical protein